MKQADEQREAFEAWAKADRTVGMPGSLWYESAWKTWQAALAAALPPAAVQAGWKLVPIEPTDAMYQAAEQNATRVAVAAQRRGSNDTEPGYCSTYRAMLAAVAEGTLPAEKAIYESRFRTVLDVVQRYLPPGGTDAKTAMGEITALVDPWPGTVADGVATVAPTQSREAHKAALMVLCAVNNAVELHPSMEKDIAFAIEATRAALGVLGTSAPLTKQQAVRLAQEVGMLGDVVLNAPSLVRFAERLRTLGVKEVDRG